MAKNGASGLKVGIDLTALLPQPTGVDNYMCGLVLSLGRVDRDSTYTLFVNLEDRHLFRGALPGNFSVVPLSLRPRPSRLIFQQVLLPMLTTALGIDVLHSPSFILPLVRGKSRHVLTVHDMTSFSMPAYHIALRRSWAYRQAVAWSVRRADLVIVPTRAAASEVIRLLPDVPSARVLVIPSGVGEEFRPRSAADVAPVLSRLGLGRPYILHVGTIEPRKNLPRLIESYRRLVGSSGVDEELVLAGQLGWDYRALLEQLSAADLRGGVRLLGYVAQSDLPFLYAGARLFVYPSLEEGFGFPPLEAMACGVPTVASRAPALAENLEGAAELVEPTDEVALAAAIERMLRDEALRAERRKRGLERVADFRWEAAARRVVQCYRSLAAG
jgi:alpha-1,3-rhamnosyl/mannosyltransferase